MTIYSRTSLRYAFTIPSLALAWPAALALLIAAGCGQGPKYSTATVSGRVTIDGVPVPKGALTFAPLPGTTGAVVGAEIKMGEYHCSQVPLGKLSATFIAQAAEPMTIPDKVSGGTREVPRNILPAAYLNGVTVSIDGNRSDLNFDLTSKGP
jgi:hypothetical protein